MERLRFALQADGQNLEGWHQRCLEHLDQCATLVDSAHDGGLDFVLKLGRHPIPPGVGVGTRYGAWCFQHELDGEPRPFFREVYDAEDVTHAALMTFEAGGGD